MNRFLYVALLGLLFNFSATRSVEARAFLVVGSTDELWPIDQNLTVDARNWIELAAQRQESTYPQTRGISLLDTSGTWCETSSVRLSRWVSASGMLVNFWH